MGRIKKSLLEDAVFAAAVGESPVFVAQQETHAPVMKGVGLRKQRTVKRKVTDDIADDVNVSCVWCSGPHSAQHCPEVIEMAERRRQQMDEGIQGGLQEGLPVGLEEGLQGDTVSSGVVASLSSALSSPEHV
jgi:hypothetical protein